MNKKIMLLGGNYYQMTATKAAKALGCHVISVDYLPNNPAHKFADEYHNVSTIDREAVLALAKKLNIDGIWSYASDVSAPTAAYVAEKLGLPTNPLKSVEILTHKDLMRDFLRKNNFNVPKAESFTNYDEALKFFLSLNKAAMVKPVDSSGSKGVTKVVDEKNFRAAYDSAMNYSISKKIIVEEFIQRKGYQIAGDGFLVDGNLIFAGLMNEHFDKLCNPLVPIGESYPAILSPNLQEKAVNEIQRFMQLVGMKMNGINLDFMFDEKEELYILEIGPRNGGNLISDAIKEATGVDLAKYTIMAALGMDCSELTQQPAKKFVSSYVIHSLTDGLFQSLSISDEIKNDVILCDLFVKPGDKVYRFENGGFGIGAMLIKFDSIDKMLYRMDHMEKYITCNVSPN
ncbi:MAG: ATP-grasp domain-containing protein [Selenomonadaceae bacterium]|nr:ATP-grasp domain-containing protein [Selenomonadaceae bacterium]